MPQNELIDEQSDNQGNQPERDLPLQIDFENKEIVVPASALDVRVDINLNNSAGKGGAYVNRVITFTSGDATPSVKNANVCITAGSTAITNFDDGKVGQVIMIRAAAAISIVHNTSNILLSGSA